MRQDTLTELEKGIDPDVLESIDETFEAESDYEDYIQKERQRREEERERKRQQQIKREQEKREKENKQYFQKAQNELQDSLEDEAIDVDSELTENTVRIKKVKKQKNREVFTLSLKEKEGSITKQNIEIGLPEDKGSEWVRLCDWVGVDPAQPTEIRGEIIPIIIGNDDVEIDIQPQEGGLNAYRFKLNRRFEKFENTERGEKTLDAIEDTFPWWGSLIGFAVGLGFMYAGFALQSVSILGTNIIAGISILIASVLISVSLVYGGLYWIGAILVSCIISASKIGNILFPVVRKRFRIAFPK